MIFLPPKTLCPVFPQANTHQAATHRTSILVSTNKATIDYDD